MSRFEDALRAFLPVAEATGRAGEVIATQSVASTAKRIKEGLAYSPQSPQGKRSLIMRAIQERGILIPYSCRDTFPNLPSSNFLPVKPPPHVFTQFDTSKRGPITTQSTIQVTAYVHAPNLKIPGAGGAPMFNIIPLSEDRTLDYAIGPHLARVVTEHFGSVPEVRAMVRDYQNAKKSKVFIKTRRGRVLEIPRKTVIKDIWAGARWPREGPCPFKDLNKKPRERPHEVDGVWMDGFALEVVVLLKADVKEYYSDIIEQ